MPVEPSPRAALFAVMAEHSGRAGVIWATSASEEALYAHLRSLNQVCLPSGERVFFRQADPNVLGAVLPLLDAGQAARMLGPATRVMFDSAGAGSAFETAGGVAGGFAGAAIGSVFGPVGTFAGRWAGSRLGQWGGRAAGGYLASKMNEANDKAEPKTDAKGKTKGDDECVGDCNNEKNE